MHAVRILQRFIRNACPQIHHSRLTVLFAAVTAALRGRRLSLSELGRALLGATQVKHKIKRIDRLLGNAKLAAERFNLYQGVARWLLAHQHCPVIIVDWSDLTADRRWQLLRAAVPLGGRCLTLYEEIHPLARFANRRVHQRFLQQLQALLPTGSTPIVITDAGFRAPWFKAVSRLGWHWIGRIRNRDYVCALVQLIWHGCKQLYADANAIPQSLGAYDIVRSNPVRCRLCLVKQPKRHRQKKTVFGQSARWPRA